MNKAPNIGICSIGSGVGQSIIDSCRLSRQNLRTIALGNNPFAFGLYECADYALLPSYYNPEYIPELLSICEEKQIDLLIPGHDDEALLLAQYRKDFLARGVKIIGSETELIRICRAKELMAEAFPEAADLFVTSYSIGRACQLVTEGRLDLPLLAKPSAGYASQGISVIGDLKDFSTLDEATIVQEIATPHSSDPHHAAYMRNLKSSENLQVAEISVQLLADQEGRIRGQCITYNKLRNGVPIEITPYSNPVVEAAVSRLLPFLQAKGLQGPLNIQGRLTDGGFKVFEINPRFTGITGLRATMGFNEVTACIDHWWTNRPMRTQRLNNRLFGTRQTSNKAIPLTRNRHVHRFFKNIHLRECPIKERPIVLVTGSTGTIGRALVKALIASKAYRVWTLDRCKTRAQALHTEATRHYDWADFNNDKLSIGELDKVIHLASARPFHEPHEIADSLERSIRFFTHCAMHGAVELIYISSQSVYGSHSEAPWTEATIPRPESLYAQHKYALEQALSSLQEMKPNFSPLVLRVGAVAGNDPTIRRYEALSRIASRAICARVVELHGGGQLLCRIDYRDAVGGIISALKCPSCAKSRIYNLGAATPYPMSEIVNRIVEAVEAKYPGKPIKVIKTPMDDALHNDQVIDSSKFMADFDWSPRHDLNSIINSLVCQ